MKVKTEMNHIVWRKAESKQFKMIDPESKQTFFMQRWVEMGVPSLFLSNIMTRNINHMIDRMSCMSKQKKFFDEEKWMNRTEGVNHKEDLEAIDKMDEILWEEKEEMVGYWSLREVMIERESEMFDRALVSVYKDYSKDAEIFNHYAVKYISKENAKWNTYCLCNHKRSRNLCVAAANFAEPFLNMVDKEYIHNEIYSMQEVMDKKKEKELLEDLAMLCIM